MVWNWVLGPVGLWDLGPSGLSCWGWVQGTRIMTGLRDQGLVGWIGPGHCWDLVLVGWLVGDPVSRA